MIKMRVDLVPQGDLKDHEEVDRKRLHYIRQQILKEKRIHLAPVADRKTLVVLDGHHRVNALRLLGCAFVPVGLVDYSSPEIEVHSWDGSSVTKDDVLRAASSRGKKFPPKTTKHMVRLDDGTLRRIYRIAPRIDVSLEELMPKRDTRVARSRPRRAA